MEAFGQLEQPCRTRRPVEVGQVQEPDVRRDRLVQLRPVGDVVEQAGQCDERQRDEQEEAEDGGEPGPPQGTPEGTLLRQSRGTVLGYGPPETFGESVGLARGPVPAVVDLPDDRLVAVGRLTRHHVRAVVHRPRRRLRRLPRRQSGTRSAHLRPDRPWISILPSPRPARSVTPPDAPVIRPFVLPIRVIHSDS